MHPYLAETIIRQHTDDLRREAEGDQYAAELRHEPMRHRPLIGRVGFGLIRAGAYLTRHAYRAA
jgi:hypothetical protein